MYFILSVIPLLVFLITGLTLTKKAEKRTKDKKWDWKLSVIKESEALARAASKTLCKKCLGSKVICTVCDEFKSMRIITAGTPEIFHDRYSENKKHKECGIRLEEGNRIWRPTFKKCGQCEGSGYNTKIPPLKKLLHNYNEDKYKDVVVKSVDECNACEEYVLSELNLKYCPHCNALLGSKIAKPHKYLYAESIARYEILSKFQTSIEMYIFYQKTCVQGIYAVIILCMLLGLFKFLVYIAGYTP